jgi:hypothetical protein
MATKTWTGTKANGKTMAIKVRAGGTKAQELEAAKSLRAAGFTTVADENGHHILCDNGC